MRIVTANRPELAWGFPRWQPPSGNGLVASVTEAEATRGWVQSLLAVEGGDQVVWAGLGGQPERQARRIAASYSLSAATLVAGRADSRGLWLALQVAVRLSQQRATDEKAGSCLTCWSPPALPPGTVRVPHLVSVRQGAVVTDTVVWELTDVGAARRHVGLPVGWGHFESHLRTLLRVRAAAREGRLAATPLCRRLAELTRERDNELSIEVVYRHAELVRVLLDGWRWGSVRDGKDS